MIRLSLWLGILGMGLLAAQPQQHQEDPADAGAIRQFMMTPFVLPALQTELSLSPQQIARLGKLKQEMLLQGKEISAQIAAKRKELEGLLTVGTSKGEVVKRLLEQIGSLRGQQQYVGYETALKMKAELTDAQRKRLAGMKIISRLSTNDRIEMMPFAGGALRE